MGGWKLEVFKMGIYMLFPVGLFYYFNQPQHFEDWVVKTRREMYPPESKMHRKEIEECIREFHKKKDEELRKLLEGENVKE